MKSLFDYELLVNEVFYRSEHILSYLENHPDMTPLDKEAIANTILDALVAKNLIDPSKESLDLSNMCIVDNLSHHVYNPTPNVTSIPLNIKEAMRHKCIVISASIPISVFFAKPAGMVSFCIYDMNEALSSLFSRFKFIECRYDSPTRPNTRAVKRPFLEVNINGEEYLVDSLTKRIFKSSWFKETYNLVIDYSISNSDFDEAQRASYRQRTSERNGYSNYLFIGLPCLEPIKDHPKQAETIYEIERSKEYFPDSFAECEAIRNEMNSMPITDLLVTPSFKKHVAPKKTNSEE